MLVDKKDWKKETWSADYMPDISPPDALIF